jgi:hypothetical protein
MYTYTQQQQQTHTQLLKNQKGGRKKINNGRGKRLFSSSPKHNVHNEQLGYNFLLAIVDG